MCTESAGCWKVITWTHLQDYWPIAWGIRWITLLVGYYSTAVQIVSCTLSDDSVLSESTGLFNNFIPNITECKENQLTWCFNGKCIFCIGSVTYMYSCHKFLLHWRHNGSDNVSNNQPHDCFLNRLFRRRSKKTSKLRVTGLCAGNSLGTGEFPAQMASNAENVSILWRHHERFG